ncbi:MAG: hypothetical protein WAK83_22870 [Trebonia sp.]
MPEQVADVLRVEQDRLGEAAAQLFGERGLARPNAPLIQMIMAASPGRR